MEKTSLIDSSFLQVTINSHKLMQTIERITKQLNEHSTQIRILREVIPTIKQSVQSTIETSEARIRLEGERNVLKVKEELSLVRAHFTNMENQLDKVRVGCERRFKEKDQQVQYLKEEKKRIQSIINLYEEDRLQSQKKINQQAWSNRETLQRLQKQVNQYDSKTDDKFQMMFIKIQSIIKKNSANSRINQDFNQIQMSPRKQRNSSIIPKFQVRRKQHKSSGLSNFTNWASFSTKITQFQKKCEQILQNPPYTNKVLYSKLAPSQQADSLEQQVGSQITEQQLLNLNKPNLDSFNSVMNIYNTQNQKHMNQMKNRLVIQQQKLGIATRKIQKLMQTQIELKVQLQKFLQKKPDDQIVQIFKNQIKKVHFQLSEEIEKKVNKQNFDKQRNRIFQKISIIQQNLTQKADKGDMKKAFLFMEQKIKQIIILIASDQNQQKNGAVRRIQAKCLSCDKGLETETTTPNRLASPPLTCRQNQVNIRTITRKIRSRFNASSQNSSMNL